MLENGGRKTIENYSSTYFEKSTKASTMMNDTSLSNEKTGLLAEHQFLEGIINPSEQEASIDHMDDAETL